jgi:DNA replication protein DnaC
MKRPLATSGVGRVPLAAFADREVRSLVHRLSSANPSIDSQRLSLVLNDLRSPAIKLVWPQFTERADKEGWPAARLLAALAEHEVAERDRRHIERHLAEGRLPPDKTLDSFAFDAVPMISRAQVTALCSGDAWLEKGANLILFGPPGGGRPFASSLAAMGEC